MAAPLALLSIARENSLPQKRQVAMPGRVSVEVNARLTGATGLWCCLNGRDLG
jgi:hypothetical protein